MHAQVDAFIGGTLDWKAMVDKLKALAKAHGDVTDDKSPPADDVTPDADKLESRRKAAAGSAVRRLQSAAMSQPGRSSPVNE